jgi:CDP-6-deoxy-D-xylo-4-hexulose-3-dehydrase
MIFPTAFSSWSPNDGGSEDRAWKRAYASGRLTMGPEVEAFEQEFADYHGRKHAVMVNSGSSANLVATSAAKHWCVSEGLLHEDGVYENTAVVPSVAWSTTYAPLLQHRFNLRVADATDSWNSVVPSPFAEDVTVVCSVLGNPVDASAWGRETHGKFVIEDNCESVGAQTADGRLCGTFGDLSTFSFFYSHQLSAVEGGAILTDDDDLARLCRLLRNHGNAGWDSPELEGRYDFTVFGYNLRPTECHAAVAREQLKKLDATVQVRRDNLMYFADLTSKMPIKHQKLTSKFPSPFGLAFECESRERRNALAVALRKVGIDSRLPTGGSFLRHQYGKPWADQKTPRADLIHERGMFLGNSPRHIPGLIEGAVRVMKDAL